MKTQNKEPFPSGSIFYLQAKCGPMVITRDANSLGVTGKPGKGDTQEFAVEYEGETATRVAFRQVSTGDYLFVNSGRYAEKLRIGATKQWWIPEIGRPPTGDNGVWLRNETFGGYLAFWDNQATWENWAAGITLDTWFAATYTPAMTWMVSPTPEYEAAKKKAAAAEDEAKAKSQSVSRPVANGDDDHCCSNCENCVK